MTQDQSSPAPEPDPRGSGEGGGAPGFSFSDRRRVDPTDGSVRPSGPGAAGQDGPDAPSDPLDAEAAELFAENRADGSPEASAADGARVAELEGRVAELTEELKRSQAEYVNSRRRIEASAATQVEAAAARVLGALIGVLDDIDLARRHGDLAEGTPFASIAGKLEDAVRGQGMQRFGAEGEEFDPTVHEALMHEDSADVETNTVATVLQPGYRMGERVLRPARVGTRGPQ